VVAVAARPLCVDELAQFLGFDFAVGPIPKFCAGWLLEDPIDAVLSATSSLLSIVDVHGSPVVQFSHFSVKEFLTSPRLAKANDDILYRYHVSIAYAHTLAAQACLGILLHLDKNITIGDLERFPLTEYAAVHWVDHARFEDVSRTVEDGMKRLFGSNKYHFSVWVWIHDLEDQYWRREKRGERPSDPRGTPLHYAALCGLDVVVKFLIIEHSLNLDTRCFGHKSTALHLASRRGHVEVIRVFIDNGADPGAQNKYESTPLHMASSGGHVEAVRLLLERGVNAILRDDKGFQAVDLAYQGGHWKVARVFLEFGHGGGWIKNSIIEWPLLNRALFEGNIELTCDLLEHGADLSVQSHDQLIPLQAASLGGHTEAIRVLLQHGVDMTARRSYGLPPLHLASLAGHVEVVRILLEHGADATTTWTDGATSLDMASFGGHVGVVRILLQHGINPTSRYGKGCTSLHIASQGGYVEIVRLLLECGADADARDGDEMTPLHFAAGRGHMEVVCFLLERGANVTAQDYRGCTPLNYASESGHVEVSRVLFEHSLDAEVRENHG
jgi:ankyrin repeat protein